MVDFLKYCDKDRISIHQRAKDCELNLIAFNCATPMASCAEILLKTIFKKYNSQISSYAVDQKSLDDIIRDPQFQDWFYYEYGAEESLLWRIDDIRRSSNKFKHCTQNVGRITPNIMEEMFRSFYDLVSLYYANEMGRKAPEWSKESYAGLIKASNEIKQLKENNLLNRPSGKQVICNENAN